MGDFNGDGMPVLMNVNGKPHTEGGKDLSVPNGSFVFSDTKALQIKDPSVLAQFGGGTKAKTPAQLATKYNLQAYKAIIDNPEADTLDKKTATFNYTNAVNKLNALASYQEKMKSDKTTRQQNQPQAMQAQPMMSRFGGYMQVGGQHLQSGVIVDKNTNMAKIIENFEPVDSFPVITGKNSAKEIPNMYPLSAEMTRTTPAGDYIMNPSTVYGYKGYDIENPRISKNLAIHQTYPPDYARRNPTYDMENPRSRDLSYGCVNCRKEDIDKLYKYFPHGDTLEVLPRTFTKEQIPHIIKNTPDQTSVANKTNGVNKTNRASNPPSDMHVNPFEVASIPQGISIPNTDIIDYTNAPGWHKRYGGEFQIGGDTNTGWYNRQGVTGDISPYRGSLRYFTRSPFL